MGTEIEAKLHVVDHEPIRRALRELGAQRLGRSLETNIYFDRPDGQLRREDRGLRIRIAQSLDEPGQPARITVTYKGPRQPSAVKVRQEEEFAASEAQSVQRLFEALGLVRTLSFQKRRESWRLDACLVLLDEAPHLGAFVEIEGPDEANVTAVQAKLGLGEAPVEKESYVALLAAYLQRSAIEEREIVF